MNESVRCVGAHARVGRCSLSELIVYAPRTDARAPECVRREFFEKIKRTQYDQNVFRVRSFAIPRSSDVCFLFSVASPPSGRPAISRAKSPADGLRGERGGGENRKSFRCAWRRRNFTTRTRVVPDKYDLNRLRSVDGRQKRGRVPRHSSSYPIDGSEFSR